MSISEDTSKKGRPKNAFLEEMMSYLPFPDGMSERGKQNACYAARMSGDLIGAGREDDVRKLGSTVLAILGRLDDEDERLRLAVYVIESKLSTKQAIAYLRGVNRVRNKPADVSEVTSAIAKAIDKYNQTHDFDFDVLLEAVEYVHRRLAAMRDGERA